MFRLAIVVALLAAAAAPLGSKAKERAWEQAMLTAVLSPADQKAGEQPKLDPYIASSPSVYPRASITGTVARWVYILEAGQARIVATSDSVGKRSYLAKLSRGDTVKVAVEGRNLYIAEPGGKQHRLRIVEKKDLREAK